MYQPNFTNTKVSRKRGRPKKINLLDVQINAQKILENVLKAGMLELKLVNCGIVP